MANSILAPVKPCIKCGATERDKRGVCKPCTKATSSAWLSANAEKKKASRAAWQAAHLDIAREHTAAWAKANPEALRIKEQNRRALKSASGGVLSKGLAEKLFKLQRGKCPCCAKPLGDDYHLDHKTPLALGGTNTDDNMQLLTATCNLQKGSKPLDAFMQSRGFLL